MLVFGILRLANFSMDCSYIAPLSLAVIVIRGFFSKFFSYSIN